MAAALPMAWAAVPIDRLPAIGLLIRDIFTILNPAILPKIPVHITTADVSAGIPPIVSDISIAMGVITDFGTNERIKSVGESSNLAITTTDTMPTTHPANQFINPTPAGTKKNPMFLVRNMARRSICDGLIQPIWRENVSMIIPMILDGMGILVSHTINSPNMRNVNRIPN